MRIIAKRTLREFWSKHADAQEALEAWFARTSHAQWVKPADVFRDFAYVSLLSDNRACFNIAGNKYRLVVYIAYKYYTVYIRFIGTHKEYDRIDANTV